MLIRISIGLIPSPGPGIFLELVNLPFGNYVTKVSHVSQHSCLNAFDYVVVVNGTLVHRNASSTSDTYLKIKKRMK